MIFLNGRTLKYALKSECIVSSGSQSMVRKRLGAGAVSHIF